jgi:hypothetical protein
MLARQMEVDGKQTTDESSRNRPKEWRRLEHLTDRSYDDDDEKWAAVSIYRTWMFFSFSSFRFL